MVDFENPASELRLSNFLDEELDVIKNLQIIMQY
jgi:hypothetical protein